LRDAVVYGLFSVAAIGGVHILMGRPRQRELLDRVPVLSAASGVATAFVFLMLFPELGHIQEEYLRMFPDRPFRWMHDQVFLLALIGLLGISGLNRWAHHQEMRNPSTPVPFALALGSSAIINGVVGYVMTKAAEKGGIPLGLAIIAYGAHLTVDDAQLSRRWPVWFSRAGRWVLVAALLYGWFLSIKAIRPLGLTVGYCLLSGNIMADSLPHEAPGEREANYRWFVAGAVAFSLVALLTFRAEAGG
jgi:hypothetical protein